MLSAGAPLGCIALVVPMLQLEIIYRPTLAEQLNRTVKHTT